MSAAHGTSCPDTKASVNRATRLLVLESATVNASAEIATLARRNATLPPISRLPTEILADIFLSFERLCRVHSFESIIYDCQTLPFRWLVITFVCRRWRSVARALPHLWSHVPMSDDEELVTMFLRLSKGIPISVIPGSRVYNHALQYEIFSLIVPGAPRIRALRLCLPTSLLYKLVSEPPWYAPLLESITLELGDGGVPPHRCFPFFKGAELPALRSLQLTALPSMFLRGLSRPTLTSLVVHCPVHTLPVAEWLDALDALPLLEHLTLQNALADGPPPGLAARSVAMRRLAHIMLSARRSGPQYTRLLDHLVLPQCRTLHLQMLGHGPATAGEHRGVFAAVASALGGAFAPEMCSLRLDRVGLCVRLWRDAPPSFGRDCKAGREFAGRAHVVVDIDTSGAPLHTDVLPVLVSALPLARVRTLHFVHADPGRSVRSLYALQKVETLLCVCPQPRDLLHALSESQRGAPAPALFPVLRHLALRHAEWRTRRTEPCANPPLGALVDAILEARAALSAPLDELCLQGLCNVGEAEDFEWLGNIR